MQCEQCGSENPEGVKFCRECGKSNAYAGRGETALKGFEDAVRVYEVRWRE